MKYIKRFLVGLLILLILSGATVYVIITFYKKELATLLSDTLKNTYGLNLKVEDVKVSFLSNWPHASVKLKNVFVASELNSNITEPILKAESISLSFNIEKMLQKQFVLKYISINNAEINLIQQLDGSKNFEFKKQKADTGKAASIINVDVKKITLRNVKFAFINKQREQRIAFNLMEADVNVKQYSDGVKADITAKSAIDELLFNSKNGAFLRHTRAILNIELNYLKDNKTLCVYPPSYAEIEGQKYTLAALINLGERKRLALSIKGEKIKSERLGALLIPKIRKVLSNFEVKRPLDAKILLVVNLGQKQAPVILAEVSGKNCDLTIGKSKIPYSDLFFRGRIVSIDASRQKGDPEHANIIFDPIKGKIYDFPFTGTVNVTNFTDPQIDIRASVLIEAKKIKFDVAKSFVLNGSALTTIHYYGPANKLNKEQFLKDSMHLNAYLLFNDLSYKEIDRPYVYTVNGKAALNNRDLSFDNLHVKTSIADAVLKGKAENFVNYVLGFTNGFKANIEASTENLDLNPLLTTSETQVKETTSDSKKQGNKQLNKSWFEFTVNLFARRLIIRKVEAKNAGLSLFYKNNFLDIRSLQVNTCDGRITAKGNILDFDKINADVSIQDVNVKKLFEQFENFGQQAIESANLEGTMFVEGKFKVELDKNMEFKGQTMAGDVKLKLKNGHLLNFEPVQKISSFIFKNRDFNDISFTELNETFKVRGYEMQIDELEIGSNVLNLYVVNGIYNLKGNSNINILIPWSNLKKRGKNYIPKNSGESAENTKGLKLNFSGPSKNMKISLGHKEQERRFW